MNAPLARLLLLTALVVLAAAPAASAAPRDDTSRPLVYVFVLDGLDGDAVDQGRAPFLSQLLAGAEGARSTYYRESRSIMVAETNPNHVAMATGAYANNSGVPGNAFATFARPAASNGEPDDEGCDQGPIDETREPTITSGESPSCVQAQTFFESVAGQAVPSEVTTAGVFGKPKLGRIFAKRRSTGTLFADYLATPCETQEPNNPDFCREDIADNPVTGVAANDDEVMDEVIRTVNDGVPADGATKRPNLTFVNFPTIDQSGHAAGRGPAYDQAIGMADTEIRDFVENQKRRGLWSRTAVVLLSDHSMDSTPEKTSLATCFSLAGIPAGAYSIVGNGSAALVYLNNRTDPNRFETLRRMRGAALGCGPAPGVDRTVEALYREDNPVDGGTANTVRGSHPAWNLDGPRVGDLVVTHAPNGAFSDNPGPSPEASPIANITANDSFNPLQGNHGGPQTRDNTFAVIGGGSFVRQQAVSGRRIIDPIFDDTAQNPGQAENVDVAPTVLRLFGRSASDRNQGRFLAEAFNLAALPGRGARAGAEAGRERIRLTVSPRTARTGRRTRFRFRATVLSDVAPPIDCARRSAARSARACARKAGRSRVPVRNAIVRFAGQRARTDAAGRAVVVKRISRSGTIGATASRSALLPGRTSVRASRRAAVRFTG